MFSQVNSLRFARVAPLSAVFMILLLFVVWVSVAVPECVQGLSALSLVEMIFRAVPDVVYPVATPRSECPSGIQRGTSPEVIVIIPVSAQCSCGLSTPALLAMRSSSRHLSHPSVHGTGSGRTMLVQRRSPEFTCIGLVYRYADRTTLERPAFSKSGHASVGGSNCRRSFHCSNTPGQHGSNWLLRLRACTGATACCEPPAATSGAGSKARRTFVDSIRPTLAFRLVPDLNFSNPGAGGLATPNASTAAADTTVRRPAKTSVSTCIRFRSCSLIHTVHKMRYRNCLGEASLT